MPSRSKESYSIHSVESALSILEALSNEGEEIRISQLSAQLGMNKTSVFRMLATFENRGYVEREPDTGRYRLGPSAYETGQKLLSRMDVLRHARPVLERLARESGEAAYLAIRRDGEILFLDMIDSLHNVKIASLTGRRYPLAALAAGLAIQAFSSPAPAGAVTDPALAAIRHSGVARDRDALGEGTASLAAPIFRGRGEVVGSLALIGPTFRLGADPFCRQFTPRLREAAGMISSRLGYLGPDLAGNGL